MRPHLLCLFLACCWPGLSISGSAQAAAASSPPNFAAEPYVIQHLSTIYSMHADGTGTTEQTAVVKIQSEGALRSFGVLIVSFASQSEHVEIVYARVRRPDGSVLETSPTDAVEQPAPVTREAPFYSDLKQKELPIKSLRVGDTLEWQTRTVRTVPEAPGQFWGQESYAKGAVILDEQIELRVPATLHVNVWVNPKDGKPAQESVDNGERIYRFTQTSLKPTVGPEAEAAKKAEQERVTTPEEDLDSEKGPLPSIAWTTFPDWASVGDWYRKLEISRTIPDDAIKARVAELTAGKSTEREKAEALYNYVALQIRYIGVAFGIGRYQPHNAADVLSNQYGDCKDKHTLLASMLRAAGISSDAALIGADIRFNEPVPSPAAFNHLITRAHIGGHDVWLDSTAEVAPFAALLPTLRDKQALVIPDTGVSTIERTPELLPFTAFTTQKVEGALDKDLTSDSTITLTFRSDIELALRAILRQASAAQYPEFVQNFMHGIGYSGTTSDAQIDHLLDTTQPLTISLHYHRLKEESWGDNRIPSMFLPTDLPAVDEKKPPTSTLQLGYLHSETSTEQMKLPEHWGAELPQDVHQHSPFANCDVTYRITAGTLFAERKITVLESKVPQSKWKAYQKWYDDCGAGDIPFIQLTRAIASGSGSGSATEPIVTVSNDQAAKLIWEAHEAIAARDTDKALGLLNQAKALNPQQRDLWGTYGYRAYDLGMPNEAADDYRKETVFHPDNVWVYSPLSEELYRAGKKQEALAAVRSGIAIDPANENLNAMLVYQLDEQGDTKGAIEAGTAALKLLSPDKPENSRFIQNLATVQVKAGDKAGAARNLAVLLKAVTDPENQNNVAYALADIGLELPTAEAAERQALDSLGSKASAWTLEEDVNPVKAISSLTVASWDTMGWILFREGHIKEARSYIAAAWRARQDATLGLHLGDIAMADNDPNAAFTAYQLALTMMPNTHVGMPPSFIEMSEKLKAAVDRARKAGGKSPVKDWRAALQAMRTIPLGPAEGRVGSAEYRILISQGKADRVHALGHGLPKGDTLLLSTNFSEFTPHGEKGRILITGYLNCLSETCELVIEP